MKTNLLTFGMLSAAIIWCIGAKSQICTNNKDSIYGLTTTGQIVAVNVNNGGSVTIGAPTGSAISANAIGYSQLNGNFYFFNKNGSSPQQFVSYNPLLPISGANPLPLPASPIAATHTIRSGCIDQIGNGYYTIDSVHTPITHSNLIYYNIGLNTWSTLTSTLVDPSNNPIPAVDSLISGDMAFDGNNILWIICSSKWNYALYEIKTPVPTTPVASVTVQTIIPVTPVPAVAFGKVSFTGIGFNSLGTLFLTLGNAAAGNRLYKLTTPSAASLTLVNSIPADYGADLTSCSYPLTVLPLIWLNFQLTVHKNEVDVDWIVNENAAITGYNLEYSLDGIHWQGQANLQRPGYGYEEAKHYHYTDSDQRNTGKYYRIIQMANTGIERFSDIRFAPLNHSQGISIGPNPVHNGSLYLFNREPGRKYFFRIYNVYGSLVQAGVINPDQPSLNISHLLKGTYILRIMDTASSPTDITLIKN